MNTAQFEHNLREYCLRPGVELVSLIFQADGNVAMQTRLENAELTSYTIPASDAQRIEHIEPSS